MEVRGKSHQFVVELVNHLDNQGIVTGIFVNSYHILHVLRELLTVHKWG